MLCETEKKGVSATSSLALEERPVARSLLI